MYVFKKTLGFLRLYRFDVFIRFVFLYFLGSYAAVGFDFSLSSNLITALLISGISINFIYSLNSWFDADIDKINKPDRPIPSGLISKFQALIYVLILVSLSLIYPFFLFGFSTVTMWFLFFPLAGVLYSNPLFSFKRNKFLALLLIVISVLLVCSLGYFLNGGTLTPTFFIYSFELSIICAALIPFKDLSDVEGDAIGGADNWFKGGVQQNKLLYSTALLTFSAVVALFFHDFFISSMAILNIFCFGIVFWWFRRRNNAFSGFYGVVKFFVIINMLIFFGLYLLLHAGFFI